MTTFSLILPAVPEVTSATDIANYISIASPDVNCVTDIEVVLASFPTITDNFV